MQITVLGATGAYGRHVVEHLLSLGVDPAAITATGRRVATMAGFAARGVRVLAVDYDQPESLAAAISPGGRLLMISGSDLARREVQHTAILDAARTAEVSMLAYTSILRAPTTALPVAPHHAVTEKEIEATGLPYVFLRHGWYTENSVGPVVNAAVTGQIIGSVGDARVSSASRSDYAAAAAKVLSGETGSNRIYEMGASPGWRYPDLANAASELLGRPVEYVDVSPEDHYRLLVEIGAREALVDIDQHPFRQAALDRNGVEGVARFIVGLHTNTRDGHLDTESRDLETLLGRPPAPPAEALKAIVQHYMPK